jgi:hypothetical protein
MWDGAKSEDSWLCCNLDISKEQRTKKRSLVQLSFEDHIEPHFSIPTAPIFECNLTMLKIFDRH